MLDLDESKLSPARCRTVSWQMLHPWTVTIVGAKLRKQLAAFAASGWSRLFEGQVSQICNTGADRPRRMRTSGTDADVRRRLCRSRTPGRKNGTACSPVDQWVYQDQPQLVLEPKLS